MIKKNYIIISILSILISFQSLSSEIKIVYQIENEIITTHDIKEEIKYLKINKNLSNLNEKELFQISLNSLLKEKIKKKEIINYYDLSYENKKNKDLSEKLLAQVGRQIGFSSLSDFEKNLISLKIDLISMKKKLLIENYWNQLIYDKYINLIKIDEDEINNQLQKLIDSNTDLLSFDLSEIVILESNENDYKNKLDEILQSISNRGFEESAVLFSISESSSSNGRIGWVNETQVSEIILNEIKNLKIGQFSKPINTSSGKIILKVNDKKNVSKNLDIEKEKKNLIQYEQNRLLNQFSILYYKEIESKIYAEKL